MNIKLNAFLSNRKTGILSIIILSLLTLYLSSLDSKISSENNGVFALQTAFTPQQFATILQSWGLRGLTTFSRYLVIDLLFALCYIIAIPSIMSLMYSQMKIISEVANVGLNSIREEKIFHICILLPMIASLSNIISDLLLIKIINSTLVQSYLIALSASLQVIKITMLALCILYLVYLLMRRRRMIRKVR